MIRDQKHLLALGVVDNEIICIYAEVNFNISGIRNEWFMFMRRWLSAIGFVYAMNEYDEVRR